MRIRCFLLILVLLAVLSSAAPAASDSPPPSMPTVSDMSNLASRLEEDSPESLSTPIRVLLLLTVLSLLPAMLLLTTSFTRIVIVLGFIRRALTTRNIPPSTVIVGLSLFLSLFVMAPTFAQINERAIQPYLNRQISGEEALVQAVDPLREFMFRQTGESELAMFVSLSGIEQPETTQEVPTYVLIPSFVISELKRAFELGFVLFLPFLVLDLIVASVLLSMGMMMLPPVIVSAPLKILLFVLVDGWNLVAESLVFSFGGT